MTRTKTMSEILLCTLLLIHIGDIKSMSWDWFEAQRLCHKNNDTLPIINTYSASSVMEFWSGFYHRQSFWIKILGCYDSRNIHGYPEFQMNYSSAGFCHEICSSVNCSIFGLKKNKCVCLERSLLAETIASTECNETCHKDTEGVRFSECGGHNAYSVYTAGFLLNSTKTELIDGKSACLTIDCGKTKTLSISFACSELYYGACDGYLGCFEDQWERVLSNYRISEESMTIDRCRNYCSEKRTIFFGVEFRRECFCGDVLRTRNRKPESECNMECSGDASQICGGEWRINIYQNPYYGIDRDVQQNWTESMKWCKTWPQPTYLYGNISSTNASLTCKALQRTRAGLSWLGIAKEVYIGYDRGFAFDADQRRSFLQCQKCNQSDCIFVDCFNKVTNVLCNQTSLDEATIVSGPSIPEGILQSEQSLNWFEIQEQCKSENGILPGKIQINSTGTVHIWHGTYRRTSAWIKILGCYMDNTIEMISERDYRMKELSKSAGFCQEICLSSNMSLFAIKGNLCRCLKKSPKGKSVSPRLCNALCYAPGERIDKPYFDECGGDGTYSVYMSAERKPTLSGTFCVSIQCSAAGNYTFHFEEFCSGNHKPVCQSENGTWSTFNTFGNWSMSMQICKSMPSSSYLTGNVSLYNGTRICNKTGTDFTDGWLGIANEVYFGIDRGTTISKDKVERDMFLGCQLCTYENKTSKGCSFEKCDFKQSVSFICIHSQIEQEQNNLENLPQVSQTGDILRTSTLVPFHGNPQTNVELRVSTTTTTATIIKFTSTTEKENFSTKELKDKNKETFKIILPIAIAAGLSGVILALVFIYLFKRKTQPNMQERISKQKKHEGRTAFSRATGIINHSYLTIELQEQGIGSSNLDDRLEDPYNETQETTYNRLGDEDSSKKTNDNELHYDTTKNVVAKIEQYAQNDEGAYDRLGNNKRYDTSTDDTYHHACTIKSERSDYDVTEVRKQYILDSHYNHVEIIPDENGTEHDTISRPSEKENEDHTYFILEQD